MTKPDWGHGPNVPVLVFTEAEIRAACRGDRATDADAADGPVPAAEPPSTIPLTAEQLIAVLKQGRGE
jgi:hypothetical protein